MADDLFTCQPLSGEIEAFGQPYHGLIDNGVLTLPTGGQVHGIPTTTPSTVLVAFPGLPTPSASAIERAYGWELRNTAILFGALRRYAPRDVQGAPVEFGAHVSFYRTSDGGLYRIAVNVAPWATSPVPAGGSTTARLTVTAIGQIPGMPSGALFDENIAIDNSWGAPQKEWPWMSYPAPDGTKVLVSIFGGGTQSYPPSHEEGDEYIDWDPRYWRCFIHAEEITLSGGSLTELPAASVSRLAASYPAVSSEGDTSTVTMGESTGVAQHSEGTASVIETPVKWRCREDPINYGMVGEFGPGGGYIYDSSAEAKAAWDAYVNARADRGWVWASWQPYEYVPSVWQHPSPNPYPGLNEDWQWGRYFSTQWGTDQVAWVNANITSSDHSTIEATLALNTRTVTPGPVTGRQKLLACYDAAGAAVVFEVERVTAEEVVTDASVPAPFDASSKLGGASRQRHLAERHPTNARQARSQFHATASDHIKTETVRLKRGGTVLMEKTIETRTKIEETWGWEAPTTGKTDDLWLWHKRTTTTTHKVGGVQVSKVTTMFDERDTLAPNSGTSPYTFTTVDSSNTVELAGEEWGGIGSFDAVRASNNCCAFVSNNGRLFGAWSPQSEADDIPATGEAYDTTRPWVSWDPVRDRFATWAGTAWV